MLQDAKGRNNTYINEFFQVLVQVGQVVFSPLVLGNELLLALEELLAALLEDLALFSLVLDAGKHALVVGGVFVLWFEGEEFFEGDERQLLVFVARQRKESSQPSPIQLC